jgi:hypothetical protein
VRGYVHLRWTRNDRFRRTELVISILSPARITSGYLLWSLALCADQSTAEPVTEASAIRPIQAVQRGSFAVYGRLRIAPEEREIPAPWW